VCVGSDHDLLYMYNEIYNENNSESIDCDMLYMPVEMSYEVVDLQILYCSEDHLHTTSTSQTVLNMSDDEAALIANMLQVNNIIQRVRCEHTFLPIQVLRGRSILDENYFEGLQAPLLLYRNNTLIYFTCPLQIVTTTPIHILTYPIKILGVQTQ
jgi:hypothetical protein